MKRKVALFFAFVSTIICSNAQNAQMQINFVDGKVMEIPVSLIDNITWSINKSEPIKPDNTPNGVTAIDLGLPSGTKWANMNIGAKSISSYGDYFAWAETKGSQDGKTNFTEKNYKYYMESTTKTTDEDGFLIEITKKGYTKYVTDDKSGYDGFRDDKVTLELEDDAAYENWGGKWRMPTIEEFEELRDKCTWEWALMNSNYGDKITGPNGNYIFLPAAGGFVNTGIGETDKTCSYWTCSLSNWYSNAYFTSFHAENDLNFYDTGTRHIGRSIRPVCHE